MKFRELIQARFDKVLRRHRPRYGICCIQWPGSRRLVIVMLLAPAIRKLAALAMLGAAAAVQAGDIYRWVDEHGRTHMADTVPERYRRTARYLDGRKYELSEADKAAANAARERLHAEQADADARRSEDRRATQAPVEMSGGKPSRQKDAAGSECDRLWRDYYASQACFGPWKTTDEAHARCKETASPAQRCGPSKFPPPDEPH